MRLQVTLALLCVLVPKALALKCYECMSGPTGTCVDLQTDCPDQCASFTTLVSTNGAQQQSSAKVCATAAQCVNGSANLGTTKVTVNSQCCSTALCNTQIMSALPFGSANGKTCYACTNNNCTGTVACEGDADQCFNATGTNSTGAQVTAKGCATKSACTTGSLVMLVAGINGTMSCCSGSLCNGAAGASNSSGSVTASGTSVTAATKTSAAGVNNSAAGVSLSLLIMLVPLISSFFL